MNTVISLKERGDGWIGEIDVKIDPEKDLFCSLAFGATLLADIADRLKTRRKLSSLRAHYRGNPLDFQVLDRVIDQREVTHIQEGFKTGELTTLSLFFRFKTAKGQIPADISQSHLRAAESVV
jgi:hypothetical protein